ncbi:hypothetical protein V6C42_15070 [Pseudoclostridium thermosuccinogenes]|uniref:hypothetical protein n=1 Tax=Clostridium thermosuccinogenes TaxID=84032 RepID=UPI002FD9D042
MTIQDKKYGLADFILIPFKTSPMLTIIRITEKIISALLPSLQVLATASFVDTAVDIFKKGGAADRIYSPLLFLMAIIAYQNISWTLMDLGNKKLIIKLNEQFRTAVVEKRAKLEYRPASLDPVAESNVYEMFGRVSAGRSTIFITHRLGAAKLADEILVIDEGRVVEKGSHSTLMKKGGLYARMFESQRSWYKLEEEASA